MVSGALVKGSKSVIVNVAAAVYAVIVATGVFTIVVAVFASIKGYTILDLYAETFPRFRGDSDPVTIPTMVKLSFAVYVLAAAEIALFFRRRLAARWLEHRH